MRVKAMIRTLKAQAAMRIIWLKVTWKDGGSTNQLLSKARNKWKSLSNPNRLLKIRSLWRRPSLYHRFNTLRMQLLPRSNLYVRSAVNSLHRVGLSEVTLLAFIQEKARLTVGKYRGEMRESSRGSFLPSQKRSIKRCTGLTRLSTELRSGSSRGNCDLCTSMPLTKKWLIYKHRETIKGIYNPSKI